MEECIMELVKEGRYTFEELKMLPKSILSDICLKYKYDKEGLPTDFSNVFETKPWVVNYLKYPNQLINCKETLYKNYVDKNNDNLDGIAIYDNNTQRIITHKELIQMIDAFANGLKYYGIDENSRIGVMVNGTYEEPINLLSPNKIGSVVKFIDFTKSIDSIKEDIGKSNLNMLFIDEMMLPMEPVINEKKIPVVILGANKLYNSGHYLSFESILNIGASKPNIVENKNKNGASVIINSSGTTGISKPIVHSNESINNSVLKMMYTDYPMIRENLIYKAIPSHIGLGLLTTMYSGLISGTGIILTSAPGPEKSIEATIKFLKEYKAIIKNQNINLDANLLLFAAPMFYRIINNNIDIFDDLSFLGALLAAGSKMTKEELDEMEKNFRKKGCTVPICNGYGQNEQAGPVTLNSNSNNLNGSAGFPVIGTNIKIINPNTCENLFAFESGKILEKSDSSFLEYEGKEDETKSSQIILPDGEEWFDSKDLGFIDNNGFLHITGRMSRVLIRYDCKISMDEIEQKIKKHESIKDCAIIGVKHSGEEDEPIAFIELKHDAKINSIDEIIYEIQSSENKLSDLQMPTHFEIVSEIPYLSSGKIDYAKLTKLNNEKSIVQQKKLVKKD